MAKDILTIQEKTRTREKVQVNGVRPKKQTAYSAGASLPLRAVLMFGSAGAEENGKRKQKTLAELKKVIRRGLSESIESI